MAAGLKPVLWNRLTHGQLTNGEHRNTFSATAQRPFAQLRSLAGLASFSIFHLESARPAPDNRHFGWTWYTYGRTTQPPSPKDRKVERNGQLEALRRAVVMIQGKLVRIERMVLQLVGARDDEAETIDGEGRTDDDA